MQLWLCCALLVFVAGGCLAQKPRPCRSPPLYEGSLSMVGENGNSQVLGKYSYDALLQRIRVGMFERDGNYTRVTDTLLLYREQVMYEIDYEHKTCQKQELMGEFQPLEIPPNFTFLAQMVLGSLSAPGEGVLVNSWAGETTKNQGINVVTYTEFGCLPVAFLFNAPTSDLVVYTFFNIILGIKDPSVFIPPPFCDNATLVAGKGDFFSVFF
ncbi:ependymin-like isoform 5-T5 [Clarias gariepinus]|uniref:ependymin-like n=1 Tax=Clarias gariepinus TaxID=13013 RepID=UPI00234D8AF9|nr:ependymin-like [Clarias gariepinus]